MSQTKYLYNEKQSPAGMVSVSQIQTYLSCRKKWEYNYIENIMPRVERSYLTIGKLCHKGMQVAMQSKWENPKNDWGWWRQQGLQAIDKEWKSYMVDTDLLDEEIPDLENMLGDAKKVFRQAFEEFQPWKYEVLTLKKGKKEIPALEVHFKVPCGQTKGLHGYIDAILYDRETGSTWCTDYKFRKSLSPDEDESFNIQNAVYAYACAKMGMEITGTMTWQHVNTPAADPTILKDGKISRSKIKTTWEHFARFCEEHGQNFENYTEMQEKLSDIEWYRATYEYRNPGTIQTIWNECVLPVAKMIKASYGKKACNHRSLYPWNCKLCQYQSLCQAELRDYDADAIRSRDYTKRAPRTEDGSAS